MKKTYVEPTVEVVEAETTSILNTSDDPSDYVPVGPANEEAGAKRSQFLIDEEE